MLLSSSPALIARVLPKRLPARARHSFTAIPIRQIQSDAAIEQNQFFRVQETTEWPEDYVVGGLHPVHLGDVFNQRYRVIRKLGYGKYATVWLAKDDRASQYTALKISMARDISLATNEAKLLACDLKGQPCVPKLMDSFQVEGPNGVHGVLAMEPLGTTVGDFIMDMRCSIHEFRNIALLRDLSRQLVSAVSLIHSKGILHRDIQPGNFMFALSNTLSTKEEDLTEHYTSFKWARNVHSLKRIDGKPLDNHSPQYVIKAQPLERKIINRISDLTPRVMITDFGCASTFEEGNNGGHAYPVDLIPPEIAIGLPLSTKSDIWALGCTVFELITLSTPFYGYPYEQASRHQLQSLIEVLGRPPSEQILMLWKCRDSVVDKPGKLLPECANDPCSDSLSTQIATEKPRCMSDAEAARFEDFMRRIFRYDPEERPSAAELLCHPWLN